MVGTWGGDAGRGQSRAVAWWGAVRGHPVRSGGGGGGPSSILHVCKYPGEGADAVTVGCHGAGAPRTRRGELRAQGWTPGVAARPVLLNRAAGPSVNGGTRRRGRGAGGGDAGRAEGTGGGGTVGIFAAFRAEGPEAHGAQGQGRESCGARAAWGQERQLSGSTAPAAGRGEGLRIPGWLPPLAMEVTLVSPMSPPCFVCTEGEDPGAGGLCFGTRLGSQPG